jgi:hypothetical protein
MKERCIKEELEGRNLIVANLYLAVADFHESCTIRVTIKVYCTVIEAKIIACIAKS